MLGNARCNYNIINTQMVESDTISMAEVTPGSSGQRCWVGRHMKYNKLQFFVNRRVYLYKKEHCQSLEKYKLNRAFPVTKLWDI